MTLALDAAVSLDTTDYDLDGAAFVPPTPPVPQPGGGGVIARLPRQHPEPFGRTIKGTAVLNGGGTFRITTATVTSRRQLLQQDDEALLLLI